MWFEPRDPTHGFRVLSAAAYLSLSLYLLQDGWMGVWTIAVLRCRTSVRMQYPLFTGLSRRGYDG